MRGKTRIIISIVFAWIMIAVMLFSSGFDAFFTQLGTAPMELESVTLDKVQKGRAVQGECYVVYDMIGYEYTEETNKYTQKKTTTTNHYYWLVDCGDDLMLVKTRARDLISDTMQDMVDAYWDSESWEDYAAAFTGAAELDGVFIKNDSEMVSYAKSWLLDMQSANESWKELELASYTLDCTKTFAERVREFYIGSAMLIVGLIGGIIALVLFLKTVKSGSSYTPAPAGGFGMPSGSSYDTFSSDNRLSYGTTPSAASYGTQSGADTYGDTYKSQSGGSYGTSGSGYQSQSGSSYGTSYRDRQ